MYFMLKFFHFSKFSFDEKLRKINGNSLTPAFGYCNELLQINQWDGVSVEELCHVRPSNATGWLSIEYTYKHPMFGNHKVTLKGKKYTLWLIFLYFFTTFRS